jgi:hypothetical protein
MILRKSASSRSFLTLAAFLSIIWIVSRLAFHVAHGVIHLLLLMGVISLVVHLPELLLATRSRIECIQWPVLPGCGFLCFKTLGAVGARIRTFKLNAAMWTAQPASTTSNVFGYPGVTPAISANGTSDAILWTVENTNPAVLHAYDATNLLAEFYISTQASSGRDNLDPTTNTSLQRLPMGVSSRPDR